MDKKPFYYLSLCFLVGALSGCASGRSSSVASGDYVLHVNFLSGEFKAFQKFEIKTRLDKPFYVETQDASNNRYQVYGRLTQGPFNTIGGGNIRLSYEAADGNERFSATGFSNFKPGEWQNAFAVQSIIRSGYAIQITKK